jgi:carboxyl-terminal processing protease
MNRRGVLAGLIASTAPPLCARASTYDGSSNAADSAWLIDKIAARYAYLADRRIDLARLNDIYVPEARAVASRDLFLSVLERLLAELHDHHVGPNTNNDDSPQLIPTGADIWASMRMGRAIVDEVRPASAAAGAGVRAGDEIVSIAGVPARRAVAALAPRTLSAPDPEADDYTLRVLLAGTHRTRRPFVVRGASGVERTITLPPYRPEPPGPLLTVRQVGSDIACIRVQNSLGDRRLVRAFDDALASVRDVRSLILDLRNTPSGGDTDVAEPILGRFITRRRGYQRFLDPGPGKTLAKDSWVRAVDARGPFTAKMPLVVLVDRWTGSMGEGMTIGLDAMKRAQIVGARMAGLCGATQTIALPHSGIGVSFPTQRLYHLDGTPREKWTPPVLVELAGAEGEDPILARGLAVLGAPQIR